MAIEGFCGVHHGEKAGWAEDLLPDFLALHAGPLLKRVSIECQIWWCPVELMVSFLPLSFKSSCHKPCLPFAIQTSFAALKRQKIEGITGTGA